MTHSGKNRPVLVPVDFSPHSEAALVWAADFARTVGVPLVVLHVVHDPAENPGYYLKLLGQMKGDEGLELRPIEEAAGDAMAAYLREASGRHPELGDPTQLDTRLVVGVPTTRILEVADSLGARQIVMGSQGRTGLGHLMVGSKAEQVVRLSPVPVTIVKLPPENPEKEAGD